MAWIVSLFTGPFGMILSKIIGGLFITGTLAGLYFIIVNQAKNQQKLADQKIILEQVIRDQAEFLTKTQEIQAVQLEAQNKLNATIENIQASNEKINNYLSDPNTIKDDRAASDIVKETIKQLSGQDTITQKTITKGSSLLKKIKGVNK